MCKYSFHFYNFQLGLPRITFKFQDLNFNLNAALRNIRISNVSANENIRFLIILYVT